jgi:TPR repeat protein/uncharacterized caspase-like protein
LLKRVYLVAGVGLLAVAGAAHAQRNLTVAAPPASEQRVALVIGNASYAEAPLRNPVNDATDVAAALRELGFQVTLRTNARQRDMKQAIRDFGEQLARGGVGLFYFAGHGVQSRGRNFLMPIGAQIEREAHIEDESVDANFVLAQMEEARNRVNIVILDACRNNPYSRGFRSAARGLAQMDASSGTLIAFATSPGSIAADGEGRNGVYTKHLLRQVREPGLPVELMLKRVRDGVITETKERQIPWESSSLRGADFYFRPSDTPVSVAAIAPPAMEAQQRLRAAKARTERGDQFLLAGRDREADAEYRPAYELMRDFRPGELDDEGKLMLARLASRIGKDYATSLALLRPLADKGMVGAQRALAFHYRGGGGVARDYFQAAVWLKKAADQGDPYAQNALAVQHRHGQGVEKNEAEAVRLYRKAAEQGFAPAQSNLGFMYRDGLGIKADDVQAVFWFRKSAEQGNMLGQTNLGYMYQTGRGGVPRDPREAMSLYRKASDQGFANAHNNIGLLYRDGLGVKKDDREAILWFQKSAEQGYDLGQVNLALMYEQGRGVTQDLALAEKWLQKAAAQGNERAKERLTRLKRGY